MATPSPTDLIGLFYIPSTNAHSSCLIDDRNHLLAGNPVTHTKPVIVKIHQEPFWHEPGGIDEDGQKLSLEMVFVSDRDSRVHLVPFDYKNVFSDWEVAVVEKHRRFSENQEKYGHRDITWYNGELLRVRQEVEKHERQLSMLKSDFRAGEVSRAEISKYGQLVKRLRQEYEILLSELKEFQASLARKALPVPGVTNPSSASGKFNPKNFNW